MRASDPVGIIDSGVGGLSVLAELRKRLPKEDYLYLADTVNAPYGTKTSERIAELTEENLKTLSDYGCKAVVIACNTATAVAAELLRRKYTDIPIIGLEPALGPAVRDQPNGDILVLATPVTLQTKRFERLLEAFGEHKERIFCSEAQDIVSYVENGMRDSDAVVESLKLRFKEYEKIRFSACVLGCTHFPFAKKEIETALGYEVTFYDGAYGAARRLEYLLKKEGLLGTFGTGNVTWLAHDSFAEKARRLLAEY